MRGAHPHTAEHDGGGRAGAQTRPILQRARRSVCAVGTSVAALWPDGLRIRLTPRAGQRGAEEEEAEELAADYFYNGMSKEEIEASLRDAFAEARPPPIRTAIRARARA